MDKKAQGVVNSQQAYIKSFNGSKVTLAKPQSTGVSGETDLYALPTGGGIYLKQDEVQV